MKVIVDRFEENFAVCEKEDRKMIRIDKNRIPKGIKEGDVLNISSDDTITFDKNETEKIKKEIADLTKDLWE